ncbi:hypothetical protein J6590_088009 [Homalodisca vitripennis]|nr:hypothetical protein J6590_088009 [Homalodisca vitripennis]
MCRTPNCGFIGVKANKRVHQEVGEGCSPSLADCFNLPNPEKREWAVISNNEPNIKQSVEENTLPSRYQENTDLVDQLFGEDFDLAQPSTSKQNFCDNKSNRTAFRDPELSDTSDSIIGDDVLKMLMISMLTLGIILK